MFSSQQSQVSSDTLYVEDVFSAFVRTGTGASATVTTGLDLSGGGLIISKGRSGATDWAWYDTGRGVTKDLVSNSTAAETTQAQGLTTISSTGHTWGTLAKVNTNGATYVDLCWKKAAKFFDVVTWTGDGTAGRNITHSLGQEPGMIVTKKTSATGAWYTYHRSAGLNGAYPNYLALNQPDAAFAGQVDLFPNAPTSTYFTVGNNAVINESGATYVAYLFAHDTSATGLIQCGSFTSTGAAFDVTLGWEPQYVLFKAASTTGNWRLMDVQRSWISTNGGIYYSNELRANTSDAEAAMANPLYPTATGFKVDSLGTGNTYIYLAIRRGPMKAPTSGTQVYNAIARTGTGAAATVTGVGFPPDLVIGGIRDVSSYDYNQWQDRLRGATRYIYSALTNAEASSADTVTSFDMGGMSVGTGATTSWPNQSGHNYINWFFRRYPGVFDQVCYTGTGVAKTEAHNLGVVPELMIVKCRSGAIGWLVYHSALGNTQGMYLNTTGIPQTSISWWNSTTPTTSVFSLGASTGNNSGYTFTAYLFATLVGISKVGSYTGTGTTKQVDCGFAAGARFVLIKRTDSTGDWYLWDSVRGIIAGNDPFLLLNSAAAEATATDYIDPLVSGFEISSTAPAAINASGGTFIYLAFA